MIEGKVVTDLLNIQHMKSINRKIISSFSKNMGISEEDVERLTSEEIEELLGLR